MTEEQKLNWLKDVLSNGVYVAQINLGDGTQYIQMNDYGKMASMPPCGETDGHAAKPSPKQGEPAQPPLASSNIIFNPHLFTTEAHYERLRETIFAFFGRNGEEEPNGLPQIAPEIQAEWYYILKAINEAGVTGYRKLTTMNFLKQMLAWYPSLFIRSDEHEDDGKMLRRYASSISAERNRWMSGVERHEASIRDMFALANTRGYDQAKTLRTHGVAQGLKDKLLECVSSF